MRNVIFSLLIGIIVGVFITNFYFNINNTHTEHDNVKTTQKPTQSISFELRQNCAKDANMLMNRLYQQNTQSQEFAKESGIISQFTSTLWFTTFSNKLNTCVAEVNEDNIENGKRVHTEEIYDTVSGRLLAQNYFGDSQYNFIPNKTNNVSSLDYLEYKSSIGL